MIRCRYVLLFGLLSLVMPATVGRQGELNMRLSQHGCRSPGTG